MLKLLYDEARLNILDGRYPCDPEQWLALGALTCAIELGIGLDERKVAADIRYPSTVLIDTQSFVSLRVVSKICRS